MAEIAGRYAGAAPSFRPWRCIDDDAVRALDERVQPYADADEPEVQVMYRRADAARRIGLRASESWPAAHSAATSSSGCAGDSTHEPCRSLLFAEYSR